MGIPTPYSESWDGKTSAVKNSDGFTVANDVVYVIGRPERSTAEALTE
jgi:hypothetical protein